MDQYTFNAAKFKEHAAHLSPMEELAYRRLIDQYYITETPIDADIKTAARKIGLREHAKDVEIVLNDFFQITEAGWTHSRIEQQIKERKTKARISRDNGQSGGRPKKNNPEKTQQVSGEIDRIFKAWQEAMQKPRAKLTAQRKKLIAARIKEGYTVEQIEMAIEGCAKSPFHMGQNENGTKYNDITLICRNGEKIESFADRIANPVSRVDESDNWTDLCNENEYAQLTGGCSHAGITDSWRPSEEAYSILSSQGVPINFAQDSVPEFVLYWKQTGQVRATWDSAFICRVKSQWERQKVSKNESSSDDWTELLSHEQYGQLIGRRDEEFGEQAFYEPDGHTSSVAKRSIRGKSGRVAEALQVPAVSRLR